MKYFVCAMIALSVLISASAGSAADQSAARLAIEQAVKSYTAAFNAGDSAALAAHWSPEAVYVNPLTGNQVEGRSAIQEEFDAILAGLASAKLNVEVDSIQFISPTVAVENGIAQLVSADGEPEETSYTAIHVKRDGKWLLDRVSEEQIQVAPSHYEHLKQLEWMIGSWIDEGNQGSVETACEWTRNQSFITRSFTVSVMDEIDMAGMQIIGWDPVAKQIRSWVFDSDGGFAEGRWTKKGDRWFITTNGTTPDGLKTASINVLRYVADDQFTWKSVNRTVGGKLLPNVGEVVVVRSSSAD